MNTIDFTKQGGFPFTQDTLDFMQREYVRMLNGIGTAWASSQGGQYVILSGCGDGGNGNISAGICSVNGEMVYCPGGSGAYVRVVESTQDAIFENGSVYPVYLTRMLMFQEGDGQIAWSEFKRVGVTVESILLGGAQTQKVGTEILLPGYPTSLPANGGNADTLGNNLPAYYAEKDTKEDTDWVASNISVGGSGTAFLMRKNYTCYLYARALNNSGTVDIVTPTDPKYFPIYGNIPTAYLFRWMVCAASSSGISATGRLSLTHTPTARLVGPAHSDYYEFLVNWPVS